MHPSPATTVSALLLLAALALVVLTAVTLRPRTVTTQQFAPGSKPRVQGGDPSARRTARRGAERRTARPAARKTSKPTPAPTTAPVTTEQVVPPEAAQAATPATPAEPEPAPQEAAVTPPPQEPETVVERYYRALDAGRFEDAWTVLTPAVRASFGPFEDWRAGYETTLSNSPRDIEVTGEGDVATIAHELVTEDRSSCGPVERRFGVLWKLVATAEGWRAASLTAEKLAGQEPADACGARQDAARATGGHSAG